MSTRHDFRPVDPNWFELVIGTSRFETCSGGRESCLQTTPYDMLCITHRVLGKMDYSEAILSDFPAQEERRVDESSEKTYVTHSTGWNWLEFWKCQCVAFCTVRTQPPNLSVDTTLTSGLLPAGSGPRTITVVSPGLRSQCFCQRSTPPPSIISIDLH